MNASESELTAAIERIRRAFHADNADEVRRLLNDNAQLRTMIDAPVGPFDSPAIVNVRSRAMLDVLLDAGANVNAKSNWWAGGFGLLHSAKPELAAYAIERGAAVDVHAAARLGLIDKLRDLLDSDPELVHARGGDGQTPLHFACSIPIAEYLLNRGANVDACDVDHESTPAQWKLDHRQDVARFLVSRGCRTDLLMAAALGDVELARRHLDADPPCLRMYVGNEYFPPINPKSGGTIYQWTLGFYISAHRVARKFGRSDVLELLVDRSPPNVLLVEACWQDDEAAVQKIRTEHPNCIEVADFCQLAHAARNNETRVVDIMLECGMPVDVRGQHQGTPLHWAAYHGNAEMTRNLLRFHPPLEATDADFNGTPLGWAIHGSENGWHAATGNYAATVELLLQAGCRPPARVGGTPAVQEVLRKSTRT